MLLLKRLDFLDDFRGTAQGIDQREFNKTTFADVERITEIVDLAEELGTCHPCLSAMEQRMLIGQDGITAGT